MNAPDTYIKRQAKQNLEAAGAYGRTIDRWWNGFYTNWNKPTIEETPSMTAKEIN